MTLTRTQMQEVAARAAEAGDRFASVYWSCRSYSDSPQEARTAAAAAVT